ncbi:MAG TPA: AraC family transcriptional regulator [Allosphingosinicella sp.]|nr:AraC family transcriptional regulator [Allosphingosinicella sp.]
MDPFSDLISLLRPHAAVSKPIEGRGTWGVRYAAYGRPGFALMLQGQCWLTLDGEAPVLLEQGDFVLLPATPTFALSSAPGLACAPHEPAETPVRHGEQDGAAEMRMFGGAFRLEPGSAPLLLPLLPAMIHVRARDGGADRLRAIIGLIADECGAERPGRDLIVDRLLEAVLVECLRREGGGAALPAGLLAGLREPGLARALGALHADVGAGWTVAGLAGIAGMSRSAFAARFGAALGCAPMEYLARWRMVLAQDRLRRGGVPLERLAEEIGYDSASAFSTAFRRRIGCAPGAFARARRREALAG